MVGLAHVVKSCNDLTIYASDLSQPEKLMDSLSNKYIDITQLEMLVLGYRASVIIIFDILQISFTFRATLKCF